MLENDTIKMEKYLDTSYDLSSFKHINDTTPKYGVYEFIHSNPKESNEAIGLFYNVFNDEYDFEKMSKMLLYLTIVSEPFFDQLRTKEQLGYLVRSGQSKIQNTYGIIYQIQSSAKDSKYLAKRIKDFNTKFHKTLTEYGEFETQKNTLMAELMEPDKRINQLIDRIIGEISIEKYVYDRKEKLKDIILKLKLEDIVSFHKEFVLDNKNVTEIHNIKQK